MELLRSGCSSTCGRAVGAVVLVSAFLVTTEPLARPSPDDILTILTRQMSTFGGPLVLAGAGPGAAAPFVNSSPGTLEVADASSATLEWPSGKPNPFDPGTIARGAVLPIIGEIRELAPQARRAAPRALAATDRALEPQAGANYTFAELFGPLVDLFSDDDAPDEETGPAASTEPKKPAPKPASIASLILEEKLTPPPAEPMIARTPSPAPARKADVIVTAASPPPTRQPAPAAREGAPALHTESPASWSLPTERIEEPEIQAAPEELPADVPKAIVLAAAEDDPAPPQEVVNYTFTELFGSLGDFFSGTGDGIADASETAPAIETVIAAAEPGDSSRPIEATRPDAPLIVAKIPLETIPPPAEAAEVVLRDDTEPRDMEIGNLFTWISGALSDAPIAQPEETAEIADATPEAAPAEPVDNKSEPASPPVASEVLKQTPPVEVADVISRDEDEQRDEPQDISGLFAWVSDAFSSAPGAATVEAVRTEPDLALVELPNSAVSAGSSTTPSQWNNPDREMPTALAELLGAPELAQAVENMRARKAGEKGVIDRLTDLQITGDRDSDRPGDDGWAVKNVEIAQIPPALPRKPRPVRPKKHYLSGVALKPGATMSLGKSIKKRNPCVEKKHGTVIFCLEPVQ